MYLSATRGVERAVGVATGARGGHHGCWGVAPVG
jgi:hypothetical protein